VYLLGGAGSNVVASVGDDGVLLVDTGYRAALPALRRAVATLGATKVARVILTHPHEDHWGMAPDLGAEAEIWAHPGTTRAMAEPYTFIDGVVLEPKPEQAWPVMDVIEGTFWFNEEFDVFEVSAHTGADLAVHFAGSGVLHMGDAYLGGNPMMFPGGEDPDGFLGRLESRLAAMDEGTIVVGGHDAPVGLDELRNQIQETRFCMNLVRRALSDGKTLEETVASAGDRFAPQWVGYFYRLFAEG
jgi:cyclase